MLTGLLNAAKEFDSALSVLKASRKRGVMVRSRLEWLQAVIFASDCKRTLEKLRRLLSRLEAYSFKDFQRLFLEQKGLPRNPDGTNGHLVHMGPGAQKGSPTGNRRGSKQRTRKWNH